MNSKNTRAPVLYFNGRMYYSSRDRIYTSDGSVCRIPDWKLKYLPPLLKRLLRGRIFHVAAYNEYLIVVLRRRILLYRGGFLVHTVDIDRGSRPLKSGLTVLKGSMYYGDYWGNPERAGVNLYKVDLGTGKKEVLYQCKGVRHIHFVRADLDKPDSLLIGTGDYDDESGIYRLPLPSGELEEIGAGSQTYRAVDVLQHKGHLFWGSDDPDGENFIYRLHRPSGELEQLNKIEGPAYYAARDKKGCMYISTAVEKRDLHSGVIYKSSDSGKTWEVYRKFKKDIWHGEYFGHGVVEFIQGQDELEELHYNLIGLKELS